MGWVEIWSITLIISLAAMGFVSLYILMTLVVARGGKK